MRDDARRVLVGLTLRVAAGKRDPPTTLSSAPSTDHSSDSARRSWVEEDEVSIENPVLQPTIV